MMTIIRPYRNTAYSIVDAVLFLALIQVCLSLVGLNLCTFDRRHQGFVILTMLISAFMVPALYLIALVLYKIIPKVWNTHYIKKLVQCILGIRAKQYLPPDEVEDPLLKHIDDIT